MVLGVHGEVVDRRGVGQVLRHRPGHQHAVAFQAQVVVQPPGVVLLDDEVVVIAGLGLDFGTGSGVFDASRMLRYFVSLSASGTASSSCASRSPSLSTRSSTSSNRRCRSLGSSISSQVRGAATVGCSRPRSEYGAIVVFDPLFWLQSRNTLPARRLFVIVEVTSFGIAFSSCCATRLANTTAPRELTGSSSGAYRCRPLLPLVSGIRASARCRPSGPGPRAPPRTAASSSRPRRGRGRTPDGWRARDARRRIATAARAPPARPAGRSTPAPSTVSMIG